MRKPNWKIAVAGGALAGLSVGGFNVAAAAPLDAVDPDLGDHLASGGGTSGALASPGSTTVVVDRQWAQEAVPVGLAAASPSPVSPNTPTSVDSPDGTDPTQAQVNSIRRLYRAYFLRNADPGGLAFWSDLLSDGAPLGAVSAWFAQSPEFQARYGSLSNDQFVRLIYDNVLGRAPDAGGLAFWTSQLDGGQSRGWVMIGFSESPEFRSFTGIG